MRKSRRPDGREYNAAHSPLYYFVEENVNTDV